MPPTHRQHLRINIPMLRQRGEVCQNLSGTQFLWCCLFTCPCFGFYWTLHHPHCLYFFFLVRKADLNITIFADCRLNSRHTVSLQRVVPLTNWLWKAKLGHLSNYWSNSDVISLLSPGEAALHPLFVITDQCSTSKQEKASGPEQHCAAGDQQHRAQTQGLSRATGFALRHWAVLSCHSALVHYTGLNSL